MSAAGVPHHPTRKRTEGRADMRAWSKMLFGLGLAAAVAASLFAGRPAAAQDTGTVEIGGPAAGEAGKLLPARNGGPKGKILSSMRDSGDSYALDIEKGFEEVLGKYPDIKVIAKPSKDWEPTNAANTVQDQLLVN